MESFSIECTTCRARLKVRDESAIGQILTCPKCSSMVLVERPAEPELEETDLAQDADANHTGASQADQPADAPVDAPEVSDNKALEPPSLESPSLKPPPLEPPQRNPQDATSVADLPTDSPAHGPTDAPPATKPDSASSSSSLDSTAAALSDTVEDLSVYGTQQPPPTNTLPLPTMPASLLTDQPLLPSDAWVSDSSQRVRNWLMLAGAATLGIFVAVGLFALVAMQIAKNGNEVAKQDALPVTTQTKQSGETAIGGGTAEPPTVDPGTTKDPSDDRGDTEHPAGNSDRVDNSDGNSEMIAPDKEPIESIPPENSDVPSGEPPALDTDLPPGFVDSTAGGDEPPGFVTSETSESAVTSLDKTLRSFVELLDEEPPTEVPLPPAVEDLVPEKSGPPRPEPRAVDITARLADTIDEIQFDGTSLNDFLRFVANYSTIPISLDPDATLWLEISPVAPVAAHQKAVTVESLVRTVVGSVGLTAKVAGDQLLVTLPEEGLHPKQYTVSDLATSEAELRSLARQLVQLVARDAWQLAGGLGTIAVIDDGFSIQQTTAIHRQTVRFLEKLRVARGLSPRSGLSPSTFELTSRYARARKPLEQNITLNFFQPTQLDRVVDRLAKAAECLILIDWQSLHQAGWNSDTLVTLTVTDEPLGKTLDELLDPMGLDYRCVDAGLLQITSAERMSRQIEFEVYPIPDLLSGGNADELMANLRAATGERWFVERGGQGVLAFDPTSSALLASLPQPAQITLEKALAELRAGAAK